LLESLVECCGADRQEPVVIEDVKQIRDQAVTTTDLIDETVEDVGGLSPLLEKVEHMALEALARGAVPEFFAKPARFAWLIVSRFPRNEIVPDVLTFLDFDGADYSRKNTSTPNVLGGPFFSLKALERDVPYDGLVALPLRWNTCSERHELAAIVSSQVIVEFVEDPDEAAPIQLIHVLPRPYQMHLWKTYLVRSCLSKRPFPYFLSRPRISFTIADFGWPMREGPPSRMAWLGKHMILRHNPASRTGEAA
jgi:hypothetical protein